MNAEARFEEWWEDTKPSVNSYKQICKRGFLAGEASGLERAANEAMETDIPNETCEYELVLRQAISAAIRQVKQPKG